MGRVVLTTYSGYIRVPSSLCLDNGLANLAGCLMSHGHEVAIEDYNSISAMERMTPLEARRGDIARIWEGLCKTSNEHERKQQIGKIQNIFSVHQEMAVEDIFWDLAKRVNESRATVVGFKCWLGDGLLAVKKWCAMLRGHYPAIKILLGGPCCEIAPYQTAQFIEDFDVMVMGEGEEVISQVVDFLDGRGNLEDIPGILYRAGSVYRQTEANQRPGLDDMARPVYDPGIYRGAGSNDKLNFIMIDESRGCPMGCNFCAHPQFSGKWRTKSVKRILEEIEDARNLLKASYFRFAGSNTPPSHLRELAKKLREEKVDIKFSCFVHINNMKTQYLKDLHEAGLRGVFYGIESGDQELLERAAGKRIDIERAAHIIKETMNHEIFTAASFIYPLPFETNESSERTRTFIMDVFKGAHLGSANILNPNPFPKTKWWNQRKEFGF